ncbi:CobW family GTP-binding protein [Pseudomonas sp. TCU-HL1]|uniref:CobW family GTP-binding protein n=1 Tax=Pseudomonas sp. TCU-HL1 TaxID=1856685 RepID=UPI00083E5675|nr:GTP-binding protein [Pseudomonas sp. TCU-HL1]AOE85370.1 cobalamin synthesis protein P47K [Pseudomonas sp. TCU-HL1]
MSRLAPIPVTLVSGFLGAGKTTLLNRILNSDHGLRMAVMVNDFGAINIDSQLIVSQTQTTVSLANGCICCTVESDLIEQLGRLLDDCQNRPEYIVIEASGVSNPGKIANTLRYPQFRDVLAIDSILTVVDAEQFGQLDGEMAQLAMEQLDVADIIVLNKVDRVSREQLDTLKARWLYPKARLLECEYGEVPLELVLGVGQFKAGWSFKPATTPSASVLASVQGQDHSAIFDTWSFSSDRPLSLKALRQALAALPADIYRAKGVCQVAEAPGKRCILHLVGSRSEIKPEDGWEGREPYTQLIFIGRRGAIDAAQMQATFEKCVA